MSIYLFLAVLVLSVVLASFFVLRDAKKFALSPPSPLVDLDRIYDVLFQRLDEHTGSKVTPKELDTIIHSFLHVLWEHNLVSEKITDSPKHEAPKKEIKLTPKVLAEKIKEHKPDLDVDLESIETIVDLSFSYLEEINAIIAEV